MGRERKEERCNTTMDGFMTRTYWTGAVHKERENMVEGFFSFFLQLTYLFTWKTRLAWTGLICINGMDDDESTRYTVLRQWIHVYRRSIKIFLSLPFCGRRFEGREVLVILGE